MRQQFCIYQNYLIHQINLIVHYFLVYIDNNKGHDLSKKIQCLLSISNTIEKLKCWSYNLILKMYGVYLMLSKQAIIDGLCAAYNVEAYSVWSKNVKQNC